MDVINFDSEQSLGVGQEFLFPENEANNLAPSEAIIPLELPEIETPSADEIIISELSDQLPLDILNTLETGEPVQLIVEYNTNEIDSLVNAQRQAAGLTNTEPDTTDITAFKAQAYQALESEVASSVPEIEILKDYSHLPLNFVEVTSTAALNELLENPDVLQVYPDQFDLLSTDNSGEERVISMTSVEDNRSRPTEEAESEEIIDQPTLAQSLPQINQPAAVAAGYTGSGTTVAVLDTGADPAAPGLGGRIVYSQDFAADDGSVDNDGHGTNVSAITAGVAPDTDIAALDVFTFIPGFGQGAYTSDQIDAMNWSIANQATYNIVAMNMSLGGGQYFSPVTNDPRYTVIQNANAAGILTVTSSGNDGWSNSMGVPGAIEGAVSVGAVNDSDTVASFSNSANFLDLLAPGVSITAGGFTLSGTSMAAPHVAGAVAILAAADPSDSPDDIVNTLKTSGVSITDSRNGLDFPRIDLAAALGLTPGNGVDLSGAYFDVVQEPLDAGDSFDVDFEIQNTEAGDANGFYADFYLSTDPIIDNSAGSDDILLGFEWISSLAGNSTTGILTDFLTLPDASDSFWTGNGTYYIGMISDALGNVTETDETNNASTGQFVDYDAVEITINPPTTDVDLSGAYFDVVQEPLDTGDSFDVDFEIQNTEAGDAGNFWADFYLSKDPIIDNSAGSDDVLLGFQSISGLAGNSTTGILSASLTLPDASDSFWTGDGTYYIGVISDALGGVTETDETNNASTGEFLDYDAVEITITQPTTSVDNDFDGDGQADIHWRNGNKNRLWLMDGSTATTKSDIDSLNSAWVAVGNGDFDGNNIADLLYRNGNQTQIFEMDGTTVVNQINIDNFNSAWSIAGIGDTDGDGDDDILWRNGNGNRLWEMEDFNVVNKINIGGFNSAWEVAGLGDTDGDGDDDILWRNGNGNRIWEMDNNARLNTINIGNFNSTWEVAGLGDTDGDGDDDILWRNGNGNRIWEMDNNARLNTINIGGLNSAWQVEDVEDYDGDGDDDILFRNGNKNRIWEMDSHTAINKTNIDNLNAVWELIG